MGARHKHPAGFWVSSKPLAQASGYQLPQPAVPCSVAPSAASFWRKPSCGFGLWSLPPHHGVWSPPAALWEQPVLHFHEISSSPPLSPKGWAELSTHPRGEISHTRVMSSFIFLLDCSVECYWGNQLGLRNPRFLFASTRWAWSYWVQLIHLTSEWNFKYMHESGKEKYTENKWE